MRLPKGHIFLLLALAASLILNLFLGLAARHYYIAAKLSSVEPTFVRRFTLQNPTVRIAEGHQLVVLFGDSRIAQWNPLPHIEGYDLVNRGIGGETTAQMVYRFAPDVLALRPKVVIIQAGVNDLVAAGLAPASGFRYRENTVANLASMVDQARTSGVKVILLTIVPPAAPGALRSFVWSDRIATLVEETNRRLALLDDPPFVHVIDTQRVLQTSAGTWKSNVIADTLHLGPGGYEELNKAVEEILVQH